MPKSVMFQFRDGKKEVKVGDEVVLTNVNIDKDKVFKEKISKIGNKLIHLENKSSFYIDSGHEKTELWGSIIYSSEEAVIRMKETEDKHRDIREVFSLYGRVELTPEMIDKCHEVIFGKGE